MAKSGRKRDRERGYWRMREARRRREAALPPAEASAPTVPHERLGSLAALEIISPPARERLLHALSQQHGDPPAWNTTRWDGARWGSPWSH